MIMKNLLNKKGFTLVETLVAVTILLLATTAAMSAIQMSLQSSLYAQNQITAYYLAEEALEYVHNIRDNNALIPGNYWLEGLEECFANDCRVDTIASSGAGTIEPCSGSDCRLKFDADVATRQVTGYWYGGGVPSNYTRTVRLERVNPDNPDEVMVTATVVWVAGRYSTSPMVIKTQIYNWQ